MPSIFLLPGRSRLKSASSAEWRVCEASDCQEWQGGMKSSAICETFANSHAPKQFLPSSSGSWSSVSLLSAAFHLLSFPARATSSMSESRSRSRSRSVRKSIGSGTGNILSNSNKERRKHGRESKGSGNIAIMRVSKSSESLLKDLSKQSPPSTLPSDSAYHGNRGDKGDDTTDSDKKKSKSSGSDRVLSQVPLFLSSLSSFPMLIFLFWHFLYFWFWSLHILLLISSQRQTSDSPRSIHSSDSHALRRYYATHPSPVPLSLSHPSFSTREYLPSPEWVKLNVGGQVFLTKKSTLCPSQFPRNYFTALFNSAMRTDLSDDGSYFIDRDRTPFAILLSRVLLFSFNLCRHPFISSHVQFSSHPQRQWGYGP